MTVVIIQIYHVFNKTDSPGDTIHSWYSFYCRIIYNFVVGKCTIQTQIAPQGLSGQEVNTYFYMAEARYCIMDGSVISQDGWVITSIIKCGMKLLIHSQTSMAAAI